MAKKYVPSGYQIINIDVSDRTSGTAFTPETEDEKLLFEILSSQEIKKPILLNIVTPNYTIMGFANIQDDAILHIRGGGINSSFVEEIQRSGNDLLWTETEE